jgi:demethylmenaquinone methyltransferase/2-methoxy-6-polyprenyl-1,4-benzoquinol methylase
MLNEASRRATASGQSERLTLIRDSVTQIKKHRDKLEPEGFDVVSATMALGEFPQEYLDYILRDCRRLLKPGGQIMIGDECWPRNIFIRTIYRILMTVFWIPQFLLLRRPLFPIRDLDGIVRKAGFEVVGVKVYRGTSFRLVYGVKQPMQTELSEPPSEARSPESAAVGEA